MKYSCNVLTEQFLCNLWWTFCDGLYCHTVYRREFWKSPGVFVSNRVGAL